MGSWSALGSNEPGCARQGAGQESAAMGAVIRPLQARSPIVLSAFHSALVKQLLLVLAVLALAIAVNVVRSIQSRRLAAAGALTFPSTSRSPFPEPIARRILRIGFGLLWVLDGMLQMR